MLTPVLRQYKKLFPSVKIKVETCVSEAFSRLIYVDEVSKRIVNPGEEIIDLNGSYENNPLAHTMNTYTDKVLGGLDFADKRIDIPIGFAEIQSVKDIIKDNYHNKPLAVCHWGNTWVELNEEVINHVNEKLCETHTVFYIGRGTEYKLDTSKGIDLTRTNTSIGFIKALVNASDVFIGTDSGVSHIAMSTDTKCVVAYSFINSDCRKPLWEDCNFHPIGNKCIHCANCVKVNGIIDKDEFRGVNCPYHYECFLNITVEDFLNEIYC